MQFHANMRKHGIFFHFPSTTGLLVVGQKAMGTSKNYTNVARPVASPLEITVLAVVRFTSHARAGRSMRSFIKLWASS